MRVGTEFQCEIESCALGGDGVARIDGEVIFIPETLPGEKLIGRITAEKNNFSRAEVVRFGFKSPHRVAPACPAFGRCPGCKYLHADYAFETELKLRQFLGSAKAAGVDLPAGIVSASSPGEGLGYRNKVVFHVHKIKSETFFGYVMADNMTVTDLEGCPLAHPEINAEIARLRSDKSFYHTLHEGMDVTFRRAGSDVKVWRNAPPKNASWLREETLIGPVSIPCGSFFQVNPAGSARLLELFMETVKKAAPARVIDLYAGAGFFGCAAAKCGVPEILAVESDPNAAEAAKYNLKQFGVPVFKVIAGDATEGLAEPGDAAKTLLVVDPPRNGLSLKAAMEITGSCLDKFVYISCNPATWLRDAVRLARGGFRPRQVEVVNMFPRTEHFELYSCFERES